MKPYILKPHLTRKFEIMKKDDPRVPSALFEAQNVAPDLEGFPYPLPSKKSDYTSFAVGANGVVWYGAKSGLTRYDAKADRPEDIIMYFSAPKHLKDDNVQAILHEGENVWVLAGDAVSYIEMIMLTAEERGEYMREETHKYTMRRGMISHMGLAEDYKPETSLGHTECDNDGLFTACHAVGEMFRYAVLKRELGADHPKTLDAKRWATRSCEGTLLLMYIHGRPEGFISRSYHVTGETLPDDGFFYKREGDYAVCVEMPASKESGRAGEKIPCNHPIPDRLAKLYRDLGYSEDDIVYKADTSSDEVTGHFMNMWVAHHTIGEDDPELDAIIKDACTRTVKHIIDGGFEFLEHNGKPTTWAKWSKNYFATAGPGYTDAPLNAAEMLAYLKFVKDITGESGIWQKTYDELVADGYAELATKHFDRFYQGAVGVSCSPEEDLMYGDNFLAIMTYWMLGRLEKDEKLLSMYREGFKSWEGTLLREHNPGYSFPMLAACPDTQLDFEKIAAWFNRHEITRIGSRTNDHRHDMPIKRSRHGCGDELEISALLMPDERKNDKYDRNPFRMLPQYPSDTSRLEGCYPYTFAYWMGRYYGFIEEEV